MGGLPKDFIWTSYAGIMVVSQRVVDLLKANGFKGWITYPVEIHGKNSELIEGYYGLAITGRCGHIDDLKSKTVMIDYPAGKVPKLHGMYFKPSTWDGSDLFMTPIETRYVFVLEPVKIALQKAKISNLAFEKLTEVERRAEYG